MKDLSELIDDLARWQREFKTTMNDRKIAPEIKEGMLTIIEDEIKDIQTQIIERRSEVINKLSTGY